MKWHFMDWYRNTPQKKFQDRSHCRECDQEVFWGMNGAILVKIMGKTNNTQFGDKLLPFKDSTGALSKLEYSRKYKMSFSCTICMAANQFVNKRSHHKIGLDCFAHPPQSQDLASQTSPLSSSEEGYS